MAGAGYKLFATKEVLTARDLNNYLQEQSVMVFASTAARDSALTSVLAEGMVCYVEDNGASVAEFQVYDGAAWQVVWAEGGHPGSGGGGGSFDGEHVLTGDPGSPPEGWAAGQLLYDGLQDAAGDGSPHDHDYLPLSGGTLTGDLTVDGGITARVGGSAEAPAYGFADMPGAGMFAHKSNQWLRFAVAGEPQMRIDADIVTIWKGLRVEGTFNPVGGTAFGITEGIDTADVLERAETATMPAPDDEGVATTDADADSLTVNEVVTALLLKVKELSAEIKELKGN